MPTCIILLAYVTPVVGLQCYSCSEESYCWWTIKSYPERVGRCHVDDGKCFVRRDPNGGTIVADFCIEVKLFRKEQYIWRENSDSDTDSANIIVE